MNSTVTGFQVIDLSDVAYKDNATFFQGLYDRVKAVTNDKKNFIVKVVNKKTYMISQANVSVAANAVTIYFPVNRNMQQLVFQVYNTDYYTFKYESGEAGTDDYEDLSHLPKINNVELKGNKSLDDLGIVTPTAGGVSSNDIVATLDYAHSYQATVSFDTTNFNGIPAVANAEPETVDLALSINIKDSERSIDGNVIAVIPCKVRKESSAAGDDFYIEDIYGSEQGFHTVKYTYNNIPYRYRIWFNYLCITVADGTITTSGSIIIERDGIEGDVYSTSEKVVGTWIDGEPIYRKVVSIQGNDFKDDLSPMTLLTGVAELVKADAKVYRSDGSYMMNAYYNTATDYLTMIVDHNVISGNVSGYCKIENANALTLSQFDAVLEYTKATV